MFEMTTIIYALKIIIACSVVFVWFVRYDNIILEFKQYHYPSQLRDLVGILKISFALMIQSESSHVIRLGCAGLALLMLAAFITHIRVKNPLGKMLPSMALLLFSIIIFLHS